MTEMTAEQSEMPSSCAWTHWGGLVFLVVVLVAVFWGISSTLSWMTDGQRMPLSQLVVEGQHKHVSSTEVRDAVLRLAPLGSFMTQDVNAVQHAVEQLPWVKQVSVRKQWPDLLKVFITEFKPAAIWNDYALVDPDAEVFPANVSDVQKPMVKLYGPKGTEKEVMDAWQDAENILKPYGIEVASLALNTRRSWKLVTAKGTRIELGRVDRANRLHRLGDLLGDIEAKGRPIEYIDLRYDTGAAVGWKHNPEQE